MKQSEIPFYRDFEDFENGDNKYPCCTQYMFYNGLQHKYYLTHDALNFYNINVERDFISDSNNKEIEFIEMVTDKVYEYIRFKVGKLRYPTMQYRIAIAPKVLFQDSYIFRKDFEKILVKQAKYLLNTGNINEYSSYDIEKGNTQIQDNTELFNDVAPSVKRDLQSLGLTEWFQLYTIPLNQNEY